MTPSATRSIGRMEILTEQKLCRKRLHWYPVTDKRCKECCKATSRKWKKANPERVREINKRWAQANSEYIHKKNKEWLQANSQRVREKMKKWAQANPERMRKNRKRWAQANSDVVNALTAKRWASKKNASTSWTNFNNIKKFYAEARRLTELTGVKHNVDHIYPLQSEYMCGLHVETNLQILTQKENISKGNRTWPGQLDCQKGSVYARFPKELTDLLND